VAMYRLRPACAVLLAAPMLLLLDLHRNDK
jgi:hypothetical protein